MKNFQWTREYQIVLLGLFIAIASIISTSILSNGIIQFKKLSSDTINVTGSAQKIVKSDLATWKGEYTVREKSLQKAYQRLNINTNAVKKYLLAKGFKEDDLDFSRINTMPVYVKNYSGYDTNQIDSYQLNQTVQISSNDVDKITSISKNASELINQNIQFNSYSPEYFYSKLESLKVKMLADAAQNAKERAKSMATSTGNHIGVLSSAKMGVFQITPPNSTDVSDWGINDTSSLEKKITAVVTVTFTVK